MAFFLSLCSCPLVPCSDPKASYYGAWNTGQCVLCIIESLKRLFLRITDSIKLTTLRKVEVCELTTTIEDQQEYDKLYPRDGS